MLGRKGGMPPRGHRADPGGLPPAEPRAVLPWPGCVALPPMPLLPRPQLEWMQRGLDRLDGRYRGPIPMHEDVARAWNDSLPGPGQVWEASSLLIQCGQGPGGERPRIPWDMLAFHDGRLTMAWPDGSVELMVWVAGAKAWARQTELPPLDPRAQAAFQALISGLPRVDAISGGVPPAEPDHASEAEEDVVFPGPVLQDSSSSSSSGPGTPSFGGASPIGGKSSGGGVPPVWCCGASSSDLSGSTGSGGAVAPGCCGPASAVPPASSSGGSGGGLPPSCCGPASGGPAAKRVRASGGGVPHPCGAGSSGGVGSTAQPPARRLPPALDGTVYIASDGSCLQRTYLGCAAEVKVQMMGHEDVRVLTSWSWGFRGRTTTPAMAEFAGMSIGLACARRTLEVCFPTAQCSIELLCDNQPAYEMAATGRVLDHTPHLRELNSCLQAQVAELRAVGHRCGVRPVHREIVQAADNEARKASQARRDGAHLDTHLRDLPPSLRAAVDAGSACLAAAEPRNYALMCDAY